MIWTPSASTETLKRRAQLLQQVRHFFYERNYTEIETPCIGTHTVTDQYIDSIAVNYNNETRYLQTSPEYFMKRLLANGSGPIFQICKCFRYEENGKYHNPEFTMIEWYKPEFTHIELMKEVSDLISHCLSLPAAKYQTYAEVFLQYLDFCPHTISENELHEKLKEHLTLNDPKQYNKDECLQLLMSHCIEPHLGFTQPIIIYHYPASQAALAKINTQQQPRVAERFELYIEGQEIANGFHELTDKEEQEKRFTNDINSRIKNKKTVTDIDQKFLSCLPYMPECSGVALGFDRLMMIKEGLDNIQQVISFGWDNINESAPK